MRTSPEPMDPRKTENTWANSWDDLTVLGDIERAAIALPLTIPSTVIDPTGPQVPLPMLDYRVPLLRKSTPDEVKDEAWRHLGTLARQHRGDWNLYALGVGKPGLSAAAARLTRGKPWPQAQEVRLIIAADFLLALHRLDLTTPNIYLRLKDAAYTQTSGRKRRREPLTYEVHTLPDSHVPASPYGNPEPDAELSQANREDERAVFDRLVATANNTPGRQRITPVQAALITRTYLDVQPLQQVAASLRLSEPSASKQRRRAAETVARLLGRPDLIQPRPLHPEQPTP